MTNLSSCALPGGVVEVCWSPVSMLSLTRHSPASRAASQGSVRPSWGMIRQSPGTSSSELTHSSTEKNTESGMNVWVLGLMQNDWTEAVWLFVVPLITRSVLAMFRCATLTRDTIYCLNIYFRLWLLLIFSPEKKGIETLVVQEMHAPI